MKQTVKAVLVTLVRGYKRFLSPVFPPACRYVPTCSEYAEEAIARYGGLRGLTMALLRLLRCHPFVRGGFDPVPLPDTALTRGGRRRTPRMVRCSAANHD